MDQQSHLKCLKAGFKIIRKDDQPSPRIKIIEQGRDQWHTLAKYGTKAERDRHFEDLRKQPNILTE
ncbi:MAG TPA: hypothetical protein VK207_08955 [Bacteroidales bacterium]|nr:hypothetical protein [Bacteroidales bacterium]